MSPANRLVRWLTLLLAGLALNQARAEDSPPLKLDPNLPYQGERLNPVTYAVDYSVIVTAPNKTKALRVWLPLPPSEAGQEVTDSTLTTFPQQVEPQIAAESRFGNRFAYFEFSAPQGAQIIRHRFRIKVWEIRWNLEPERIVTIRAWPAEFDRYRQTDSQAIVVDRRFEALLGEIVPRQGNPLRDLDQVMSWVNDNFEYDHTVASLRADSTHGLEKRRGHCSDYHSFCAAMGRTLGYPTRIAYGINPIPKNSPSHCKLEAYLPPYGWVPFDVSETQKLIGEIRRADDLGTADKARLSAAARNRLLRGFRDNTWFVQTRGSDYDLAPPATSRVPIVRTIYAEADGVPLPEPDPASLKQQSFTWMTAHEYIPDHPIRYPFSDLRSLEPES
ncbi:MAG TPA: transglutaminase domain-containing protein [Planctomycetaceae bacterium]|nr:transglutaminase domain-containing protein [Planctomycetaceae bacterium]